MGSVKIVVEVEKEGADQPRAEMDRRIGRDSDLGRDKSERKLAQLKGRFSRGSSCLLFRFPASLSQKKTNRPRSTPMSTPDSQYVLYFVHV